MSSPTFAGACKRRVKGLWPRLDKVKSNTSSESELDELLHSCTSAEAREDVVALTWSLSLEAKSLLPVC
jgi:hypothetical protein